jgi:hypothetical protein
MSDVTQILAAIDRGEPQAAEQLLPLVYDELRKLAAARLAHEKPGQTLQATALVHEAYLRLVGSAGSAEPDVVHDVEPASRRAGGTYNSRGHFFAAAAEAMRRILIEGARRKKQVKRGGDRERIDLDAADAVSSGTLIFEPGETKRTISVWVKGDRKREANETFSVQLSNAAGATIEDAFAAATILNDD